MNYTFGKLNKVKFLVILINILISISSSLCLLFNFNIFTLRLEYSGVRFFLPIFPQWPYMTITFSSLEVLIFYLIALIPIINLFLSLIKEFRLYRSILTSIYSCIPIISCVLMFFFPKILIIDSQIYSIDFSFEIIHIGGIIAIILSTLLTFNTFISILYGSGFWKMMRDAKPEIKITEAIIKNGLYQRKNLLTCPYCRSKVKLDDYYCMFCNGIVFINSIVYKFNTLVGE